MTRAIPILRSKVLVKALESGGFFIHHVSGSHYIMRHRDDSSRRITVPMHNKDLKIKTIQTIIHQSGLSLDEFRKLL